jgi:hypothetical protein
VPAENPVSMPQGAQNMNSHPSPLSPVVPDNPFMDMASDNRHGFNQSALSLYGERGGVFDFGGQQPQLSGPGLNQMCAHQY